MEQNKMKQAIFILLIFLIIAVIYLFIRFQDLLIQNIGWIVLGLLLLILFYYGDILVRLQEYERAVVFRLGKFTRVSGPGWFLLFPFLETYTIVDLRGQTVDVPPQEVLTKEKISLKIDTVVYLRVAEDPESVKKSIINIDDYRKATRLYVGSAVRDVIGGLDLDLLISNVEVLGAQLKKKFVDVAKHWGIIVDAVEIQDITIPKDVLDAIHAQKAAEQKKLARMELAAAKKAEIEAVKEATETLSNKALSYYYIKGLEKMSEGKATKILFPIEVSKLAEFITGTIHKTVPQENRPKSAEELIIENKETISKLFGKDMADNLVKVVKEEKEKDKERLKEVKKKLKEEKE